MGMQVKVLDQKAINDSTIMKGYLLFLPSQQMGWSVLKSGSTFYNFVRGSLIPNMNPFDGSSPKSIVVMDNCSIHHVQEVANLFQSTGILVMFLPPYSPDYNPVEEAFSFVKYYLKT